MARGVYTVVFENITLSAVQDLFGLYAGATKKLEIHGIEFAAVTGTSIQNFRVRVRRLPATVTAGSGGAAATPQKTDPGDIAAVFTARINDTTQATTSGTASTQHATVVNTTNGWIYWPPREDRPRCDLSEALIVSLDTTPSPAIQAVNCTVYAEER